ncbi:MAG: restriction endonuclease subunit S [Phycisphaerae bacterium]
MKSNYKRLGDYIQLVDVRNRDNAISENRLLGININKQFMPSVANVSGTDLGKYKIIHKGQFAYSAMQVGRDECVRVALFTDDTPAIISPAYLVFEVKDESEVFPEYLMMWFQRPESDRYGWFISDSSVRASLEWERFCDIEIPIPDIDEQRKYVALYKALQKNQQAYEKTLDDLQLICDSFMDTLKKGVPRKRIGKYFELIDNRNTNSQIELLLGINVAKEFMPSRANVSSTDLSKYKIIQKRLFAYSAMQVGRDETVRVALYPHEYPAIISPAYLTFQVIDNDDVIAEFFMIWFRRPEFNRYGWFLSDSSVRASLEWERFCDIDIPIPPLEVQESIVAIHHALEARKHLNNELKAQIQNLCPILIRGVVESLIATEGKKVKVQERAI